MCENCSISHMQVFVMSIHMVYGILHGQVVVLSSSEHKIVSGRFRPLVLSVNMRCRTEIELICDG